MIVRVIGAVRFIVFAFVNFMYLIYYTLAYVEKQRSKELFFVCVAIYIFESVLYLKNV